MLTVVACGLLGVGFGLFFSAWIFVLLAPLLLMAANV